MNVLDSTLVARLVDILKSESPTLQAKVASILEFLTMIGPGLETIIATNIGSILRAIFEQKLPEGTESTPLCLQRLLYLFLVILILGHAILYVCLIPL